MTWRGVVGNQKGGSGKTTTTANLAGALVEAGARVLVVDFDPQAQLAPALGAQDLLEYGPGGRILSPTITDVLRPPIHGPAVPLSDAVLHTPFEGLDLLPGAPSLEELRGSLETDPAGRGALRRLLSDDSLASAGLDYDAVLIDTAPKLDVLLDNALVAADFALAVLAPEMQQAEPLNRFLGRVEAIRDNFSPRLQLLGVLFNKANYSWVATDQIPAMLVAQGLAVFDTAIPMYARLANAYGSGPIVFTAPNSREAGVVRAAAGEILTRITELTAVTA